MGEGLEFFAPRRFIRLPLLPPLPDIGAELNDLDQRIATRYETGQEFAEALDRRPNATIQQGGSLRRGGGPAGRRGEGAAARPRAHRTGDQPAVPVHSL